MPGRLGLGARWRDFFAFQASRIAMRALCPAQKPFAPGFLFMEMSHRFEQVTPADNSGQTKRTG
jgi:hypothetical protein